ncbi:PucR family transcriptional regulator ligand-binding domain-containing protein [Terrilactibacillus sp. S3-3]|nr:PucR family transcriptional regulator ligand-binding domain-containing protein [Terrilactibacillus sp. S3-3]
MATLQKLFLLPELKEIALVAGKPGLDRAISGVNVAESVDLAEFYRPNELIVTTGINMANDSKKVVAMVESVFAHKTAGIVLNTGPFIPEIPQQVIDFANQQQFPVFQMPWSYRIADFLKITVQFLVTEQDSQTTVERILSDILFKTDMNRERVLKELSQFGFKAGAEFGIIACVFSASQEPAPPFRRIIENAFAQRYRRFLSMVYKKSIIYLVDQLDIRMPQIPFSSTVQHIYTAVKKKADDVKLIIGMGNFYNDIADVPKSYHEAVTVVQLTRHHPDHFVCKYKDIGIYKIIASVQDHRIIETYHQDMLGPLYRYDQLHDTDCVRFLRVFLEEDGHTSSIGSREFIHRNTVLYKIKKN